MSREKTPKLTSFSYGSSCQKQMIKYYYQSKEKNDKNSEYVRVELAKMLVNTWALPRFSPKNPSSLTLVDIGCSVGLLAIEFSKIGYDTYGVDFDPAAIEIAQKLNLKDKGSASFFNMDISDWNFDKSIDIALCFDIFEHLHDDELGAMLCGIKKNLSKDGCIVFHTLPLQFDYLFWNQSRLKIEFPFILSIFKNISSKKFSRMVKIYSLIFDIFNIMRYDATHKELIKKDGHCNPLTKERLEDIFLRAGYKLIFFESGFLGDSQFDLDQRDYFYKQPITHRSLRGVAIPDIQLK